MYIIIYNYTVSFAGDNRYLPFNGTGIISVILIDVQLNITVDKSVVYYGYVVEFVITVLNIGSGDATNVTVRNVFSEGFEYISDNCTDVDYQNIKGLLRASDLAQSYDSSTGVWYIGDLANGEEAKLSILAYAIFVGTEDVNSSVSIAEIETDKNGAVNVTVIQVPTHISVGNVTARPGDDVAIPVNVTADDDVPFSGNITVVLPDGSNQTVEIIKGTSNVAWTVPDDFKEGDYLVDAAFEGNNRYLPSEGQGTVTVFKVPVDITVGNVTAKPGDDVTIPINVIPHDGSVFNGKVTVELPDGTVKVVKIVNGEGHADWRIPDNFKGDYIVKVSFNGTGVYYPATNGTCVITVIPVVHPVEENNTSPVKLVNASTKEVIPMDEKATGNPILMLLVVLLNLVFVRRGRK